MTRSPRLIRGKSVREWAEVLNVKLVTAWSWYRKGTLEQHIDGTVEPVGPPRYHGLTAREIATKLGIRSVSIVHKYRRDGTLERRLRGEQFPRKQQQAPVVHAGLTAAELMAELGVTRQRVHQLKDKGALGDRLAGVDRFEKAMRDVSSKTARRREHYRRARRPGESINQLATRLGVSYSRVRFAFPLGVPFAEERRQLQRARRRCAR